VVGDAVYGAADGRALQLLARRIVLPLQPVLSAEAPVPAHMAVIVTELLGDQARRETA
jgi:hypothetical protein